jgi:hypothetical protein
MEIEALGLEGHIGSTSSEQIVCPVFEVISTASAPGLLRVPVGTRERWPWLPDVNRRSDLPVVENQEV